MADWVGRLLGQGPSWLILVFIVAAIIVWLLWIFVFDMGAPRSRKSEFLEKTAYKKGKNGKK